MTLLQETKPLSTWAVAVAREVRKTLAARELHVTDLDQLGGRNRMYWQRRIKKPTVALDIDDLAILANYFDREVKSFIPETPEPSD